MENAVKTVGAVLAGADILCFVLLLGHGVRRITGLPGLKGTVAGIGGAAAFTAFMFLMLRQEVIDLLIQHPVGAALIYSALLVVMIVCLVLMRPRKERMTIAQLDSLDGIEFENACAGLLLDHGFSNIELTKATGDFGVDILAERGGLLYGIQCKRYSSKLGSKPVQEIGTGVQYYGCDVGAVMTNSYLTAHAAELAEAADIEIWDRDTLTEWLEETCK